MKVTLMFGARYGEVFVDGRRLTPERSLQVFFHSPSGFAWGYGGSGPAQLALALLLEAGVDEVSAVRLHQRFKDEFVAHWVHEDGTDEPQEYEVDVLSWVAEQQQPS